MTKFNDLNDFLSTLEKYVTWTSVDHKDVLRGRSTAMGWDMEASIGIKMNSLIGLPNELATDMMICVKINGKPAEIWVCTSYEEQEALVKWFKVTSSKALERSMRLDDIDRERAKEQFNSLRKG